MNQFIKYSKSANKRINRRKFYKAIDDLKVCLYYKPEHLETLINLARAYNGLGKYEEAISTCKSKEEDHYIWTATIENDLLVNWLLYKDIDENRKNLISPNNCRLNNILEKANYFL